MGILSKNLSKHFLNVHFGDNWTITHSKELLTDISWNESIQEVKELNTIATLTYHIFYFVDALTDVLEGRPLTSNDKFSFDHPPINSQEDWDRLVSKSLGKIDHCCELISKLDEEQIWSDFAGTEKYGNYFRNIVGIIEHTHYHLGQIAIIKKLIRS